MRQATLTTATMLALLVSSHAHAQAASATGQFNVTITIQKQCVFAVPSTINLGTVGANDLKSITTAATQSYTVTCSKGTGYTLGFSSANDVSAGSSIHQMRGTGQNADVIQYNLFDATVSSLAPLSASTSVISDTGTGVAQTKSIKAQILNYTNDVSPDVYTDTVTMTITY
jgi:spore coat protein U-like protein